MSVAEYHALPVPPHLNHSTIRYYVTEGPWRCYHDIIQPATAEDMDSDDKRLGRLFHLAMEKDGWQDAVVTVPSTLVEGTAYDRMRLEFDGYKGKAKLNLGADLNMRTDPHKRYVELFREQAAAEGKEFVQEDEIQLILSQVEACLASPAIVEHCEEQLGREVAWTAETDSGLILKALVDVDCTPSHIVDWKTTRWNSLGRFVRDAHQKGYLYQAAHYLHVTGADDFYFVAVTKKYPAEAFCFQMPPDAITEHHQENDKLYESFQMAVDLDSWHSAGWGTTMFLDTEGLPT